MSPPIRAALDLLEQYDRSRLRLHCFARRTVPPVAKVIEQGQRDITKDSLYWLGK